MRRYIKIWLLQVKNSAMQRMAYPINFVFMCLGVFLQMGLVIVFVRVIFGFVKNISGWAYEEAMLVVASYMIIEGLSWATHAFLSGIRHGIRTGNLDQVLTRPVDAQYMISIHKADPEDWARVATAVIIFAVFLGGLNISFISFLFYLYLIFNAYIIVYSLTLFANTISFWVIEGTYSWHIAMDIVRMSQYPTDIFFHKVVRIFFSSIIPIAFIATIPAKILIHGPRFDLIVASTVLVVIFFTISRKFWLYALRHYSSASS